MEASQVRMFEWGTVLSKNPGKRNIFKEIFPDNPLYNIQLLSYNMLKETPRYRETDLVAEVRVDACTTPSVYRFIKEFEDSSFVNLNLLQKWDQEKNSPKTKVNISRNRQHNMDGRYFIKKSEK